MTIRRIQYGFLGRVLGVCLLGAAAAGASACEVAAYPDNAYVDGDYPPADFVATAEPVYFEGRPAYWYHGRWFYRDGARWNHYDREPPALGQRRAQYGAPARRNYARPSTVRGASAPRSGRH